MSKQTMTYLGIGAVMLLALEAIIVGAVWFYGCKFIDGDIGACEWSFRVLDEEGDPVEGVELRLVDANASIGDEREWHHIGNWQGRDSLVTDADGVVTLKIKEAGGFGGKVWDIGPCRVGSQPRAMIELWQDDRLLFHMPVNSGRQGKIEIVVP